MPCWRQSATPALTITARLGLPPIRPRLRYFLGDHFHRVVAHLNLQLHFVARDNALMDNLQLIGLDSEADLVAVDRAVGDRHLASFADSLACDFAAVDLQV